MSLSNKVRLNGIEFYLLGTLFFVGTITYPTVTSKILDPTDEETAISPNPFLATITLVIKSGIEVPAAKKVSPMT